VSKTAKKKVSIWSGKKYGKSVVREHARHTYGSKSTAVLSPTVKSFAPAKVIQRVANGLPFREIEALRAEIDESLESLGRYLSISRSTLQRRRAERRLSQQESDRVLRFFRLLRHATKVFGDVSRARQWLKFPQRGLGGAIPLDYASTEVGAREVENLLGRIDYGVYS
jgi:putative toxin-antitoxin system antitoxin component (TIGR02293 family)